MPIVIEPPEAPPVEAPKDDGSNLWELLYESLSPLNDPDPDETLLKFCQAWCLGIQPAYDLVRDRADLPSWGVLFDANQCPASALPYLAQYVGVVVTPEMTEAQIRDEIAEPTGWKRGQPQALRIATRRTLVGDEPMVIIRPRTPEPGRHYIRTLLAQTPDPARTEAVIRAALPAWEVLDYAAIDGVSLADLEAGWEPLEDLEDAFTTLGDTEDLLPDELPEPE